MPLNRTNVLLIACLLATNHGIVASENAKSPASTQPSKRTYPIATCNEWKSKYGKEGKCSVETENTTWEVSYEREGVEKRDKKGKILNLLVVFHPSGNNHHIHEYWDAWVGPNKAIDTNSWHLLSLGILGDGKPQVGSPIFLTIEEMVASEIGVIDQLFPKATFVLGGGSKGGRLAIVLSINYPKRVEKLFLTGASGYDWTKNPVYYDDNVLNSKMSDLLSSAEKEGGPYNLWDEIKRNKWWKDVWQDADRFYGKGYFGNRSRMKDQGWDPKDYPGIEEFRKKVIQNWADYFQNSIDPHWHLAQMQTINVGIASLKEKDFKKLPKDIFVMFNTEDQIQSDLDTSRFAEALVKSGKKVHKVVVDNDDRGHVACCEGEIPREVDIGLRAFLKDN